MSSDDTQSALSRAYELVEAGQYDEARATLEPILATDQDNANAWWIYAHAVTDAETGRDALERVLRIDPNYPGANELLAQARTLAAPKPKITPLSPKRAAVPEAPPSLPEANFPKSEAEQPVLTTRETAVTPSARRSNLPIIAIVAVIAIALVLLFLLTQSGGTPAATPTATQIVAVLETATEAPAAAATEQATEVVLPSATVQLAPPTEVPTQAPTITPTLASAEATTEATEIDYAAIEAALSQFPIAESGVGVVGTSLGDTLLVSVCTTPGRAMRTLLPQVMNALAKQSPSLPSGVQAIGARMLNCEDNTPLLMVAVDLPTAQSYAQGTLSDTDFAATWKPQ